MATGSLSIVPGVNTVMTPADNENGITASQFIRFRDGKTEKLGGWTKLVTLSSATSVFAMKAWSDLQARAYLAAGQASAFTIYPGTFGSPASLGSPQNIMPQTLTTNVTPNFTTTINDNSVIVIDSALSAYGGPPPATGYVPPDICIVINAISVGGLIIQGIYQTVPGNIHGIFANQDATASVLSGGTTATYTTTSGQSFVLVTLNNHGLPNGTPYYVGVSTTVGGVTLSGYYTTSNVTANTFEIFASVNASSSATVSENSGKVRTIYYSYLAFTGSSTLTGVTDWSIDSFGSYLVASFPGGPIFFWDPHNNTPGTTFLSSMVGPAVSDGMIVSAPQQMIIAWGCSSELGFSGASGPPFGVPLQIRWCDAGNFNNWLSDSTNQAGSFTIPTGNKIISCMSVAGSVLVWTDLDLWMMQYVEPPNIWGFNKVGGNCGLFNRKSAAIMGNTVFWLSNSSKFFTWSSASGVEPIDCPVWDTIFQNLSTSFVSPICAAPNFSFDEVSWFYSNQSASAGQINSYVKYNIMENTWDYGSLDRHSWIDFSSLGYPIAADGAGNIFQHEVSDDNDVSPMLSSFTTGLMTADSGESLAFIDKIYPDAKWTKANGGSSATIDVTINGYDFPDDTPKSYGPFHFSSSLKWQDCRIRQRLISFTISSSDSGTWWRMGNFRYRGSSDGKR